MKFQVKFLKSKLNDFYIFIRTHFCCSHATEYEQQAFIDSTHISAAAALPFFQNSDAPWQNELIIKVNFNELRSVSFQKWGLKVLSSPEEPCNFKQFSGSGRLPEAVISVAKVKAVVLHTQILILYS